MCDLDDERLLSICNGLKQGIQKRIDLETHKQKQSDDKIKPQGKKAIDRNPEDLVKEYAPKF